VEQASNPSEIDWKEYAENYSNDIHGSTGHGAGGDDDDRRAALENRTGEYGLSYKQVEVIPKKSFLNRLYSDTNYTGRLDRSVPRC